MIVVVLSVTPERLRGVLTRWLIEVSAGVYVGHLSARTRDQLWQRIVDDVGRGRALMVWSRQNEQHLDFRTHNHAWETVDVDGITLMRRQTVESRQIRDAKQARAESRNVESEGGVGQPEESAPRDGMGLRRNWSHAARRRRFRNAVEQRHEGRGEPDP